ncbi:MAG: outer membrane protein [Saprospiraceae bacterium]|jgi:outer membrane protein|tara:strand:+ start:1267 stop:1782 length:516 start_codon:yes stop_codon:yes gene_type:complete
MIKRLFTALSMVMLLSLSASAQRIAIVDINEVLGSFADYQAAEKEIDKAAALWRQEIAQEYDQIKAMYNKYQAEQVLLNEDQKTQREDEIMAAETTVRETQKKRFGPEGDLFNKRQEMVSPIQDKVYSAIEDFAADRGYDLIFDKGGAAGLLFVTEEYDKTEDVKKRLGIK